MVKKIPKSSAKRPVQKLLKKEHKKPNIVPESTGRQRYSLFKLEKQRKHPVRLPSVGRLCKTSVLLVWEQRKLFVTITLIYGLLNLLFVHGLSSGSNVSELKNQLNLISTGNLSGFNAGFSAFVLLLGSSGNSSSQTAGAYQLFLTIIASLAIIWALRQVYANVHIRARDAYYRGMYPLVPFILVLLVCALQLLPLIIGSSLYAAIVNGGNAVNFVEKLLWALLFYLLALWSFYLLSSSLFALYVVTLNNMTPLKALRSARELVRNRRWTVVRKILALPVILIFFSALIMLPIIIFLTPLAQLVFSFLTMFGLIAVHSYMFALYREILNE